jgi:quercetin dioxygenase-like cupin family protein
VRGSVVRSSRRFGATNGRRAAGGRVPGARTDSHSHVGETFAYIESGRILNQIGDEEARIYEAGDFFFEPANANHARFENPDPAVPAVVIIYGIRPNTAR